MKRTLLISLAALLLLPLASLAQKQNPSAAAYLKWRDETLTQRPAGINTPHHAMAITLTRLNTKTLHLDFALIGKTPSHELLIQPLKTQRFADGRTEREKVGEEMTVSTGRVGPDDGIPMVLQNVNVQAGQEANELQITWTIVLDGQPFSLVHYLGFGEVTPVSSVVSIER